MTEPDDRIDDTNARVEEWVGHLSRKEIAAAIPKILASLEVAARSPTPAKLPGDVLLNLLGELAASGDAIRARNLTAAMRSWVAALPSARDAFAEDEPRWVVLQELATAEPELSYTTYVALGRLIAENDPCLAELLIRHRFAQPAQASRDHSALTKHAPTLTAVFGGFLLDGEPQPSPRQARAAQFWLWLMALVIGANLLRMWSDAQRPVPDQEYTDRQSPPPELSIVEAPASASLPNFARVEAARVELVRWLGKSGEEALVDGAADSLLQRDCPTASARLTNLETRTKRLPDEAQLSVRALWSEFALGCPRYLEAR